MEEPIRIPVTDVFDLHTVPPRDVAAVVHAYLDEAHALGLTALRIIHGKGIGVQRETVRKILARKPYVKAFRDAPAEAGSWGATIIDLSPPTTLTIPYLRKPWQRILAGESDPRTQDQGNPLGPST